MCHNLASDGELDSSPSPLPAGDFVEKVAGTSGCWGKGAGNCQETAMSGAESTEILQ
jgi:hypothetical protein